MMAFVGHFHVHRRASFAIWLGFACLAIANAPNSHAADQIPITAQAYLVIHNATGKPLLARRANEVRSIASLTKLVAALTVRDHDLQPEKPTTITQDDHKVALGGCRTRLEINWSYRNVDLLHAALMASDNRAVSALGRAVGLSGNALVQAMNEFVRAMGLVKTRFRGPVGIDHGNVSTAWEISRIVRRAGKDALLSKVMGKNSYRVKPTDGYLSIHYRNTNPLVQKSKLARFVASKTGYNNRAGYCLATVAQMYKLGAVTIVLLGSKSKQARVKDLRDVVKWLSRQPAIS